MSVTGTGSWVTRKNKTSDVVGVFLIIIFVFALALPSFITFAIGESPSSQQCSEDRFDIPSQRSQCLKTTQLKNLPR